MRISDWSSDVCSSDLTVVIVIGGPLLAAAFSRLRGRGWRIDIPTQFAASLLLMGVGFLALPAGILFANDQGIVAFGWLFASYIFQSIGELLKIGRASCRERVCQSG